ncbi:MAG: phosphate acyltransferase PlsX [Anaerolineae bacterium]|mgnify:CR=1 FL=1|nr:phosphate acyltransferase PlsX [Anaerolineae bacterium]
MKIALDAMGSDRHPVPDVEGAVLAARELGVEIFLVGDEAKVRAELARHDHQGLSLEIVHAPEAVAMSDKPGVVGRAKPDSSMHIGMRLVADGRADAFVTVGNTGAALAIATLHTLRRIPGVHRPALCTLLPFGGKAVMVLDIGANADCKAEWLAQFAVMGSLYAQHALGYSSPRVGLLSNGEELGKGTVLVQEAAELLQQSGVNFVGNVEPKEILGGRVDVAVMDGFSGNVLLKSMEAVGATVFDFIRQELRADWRSQLAGLLGKPAFRRVYRRVDPFEVGGAPLLGVNGVVIIGHGRSNAFAVKNAIRQAQLAVSGRIVQAIADGLRAAPAQDEQS